MLGIHFQVIQNASVLHNILVHPGKHWWPSRMKNKREAIPGLAYREARQDAPAEQTQDGHSEANKTPASQLRPKFRARLDTTRTQHSEPGFSVVGTGRLFQAGMEFSAFKANRIARHALVFAHDSPEVATEAHSSGAMFNCERLSHTLKVALVDEPKLSRSETAEQGTDRLTAKNGQAGKGRGGGLPCGA
jgi:hypothetical protein